MIHSRYKLGRGLNAICIILHGLYGVYRVYRVYRVFLLLCNFCKVASYARYKGVTRYKLPIGSSVPHRIVCQGPARGVVEVDLKLRGQPPRSGRHACTRYPDLFRPLD